MQSVTILANASEISIQTVIVGGQLDDFFLRFSAHNNRYWPYLNLSVFEWFISIDL